MSTKKPAFKPGQSAKKATATSRSSEASAAPRSAAKSKSLAQQIAELSNPTPKDFDPEDEDTGGLASARVDDYDAMDDDDAVPKLLSERSHIRKNFDVDDISAEYKGKVVSRKSLQAFSDDEDDAEEAEDADDAEDGEDAELEAGEDDEELEDGEEQEEEDEDAEEDEDEEEGSDGEGGTKSMLASGLSSQQKRVQQQLAMLEAEDEDTSAVLFGGRGASAAPTAASTAASQYTKSVHMQNQQAWHASMLNLRIRVQGVVAGANRLPPVASVAVAESTEVAPTQDEVQSLHERFQQAEPEVAPAYASALRGASKLLDDLFVLQHELMAQNTRIFASSSADNAADDGQEAPDDDDPDAAIARLPKWQGLTQPHGIKRKRGADDEEDTAAGGESDEETEAVFDEEEVLTRYWSYLNGTLSPFFRPVQDALIEKWNNKTQMQAGMIGGVAGGGSSFATSGLKAGGGAAGGLKAINQSVLSQIDQLMLDQSRLVKRSQLNRSAADDEDDDAHQRLLGRVSEERSRALKRARKAEGTADAVEEEEQLLNGRLVEQYDGSIYDDGDFYQQLLAEIIAAANSGSSGGEGGAAAGGHDAALLAKAAAAARKKNKRGGSGLVDRRASKGRKMRYTVHAKLANFMAPRAAPIADDYAARSVTQTNSALLTGSGFAMDELFMNLFGGQGKKNLPATTTGKPGKTTA